MHTDKNQAELLKAAQRAAAAYDPPRRGEYLVPRRLPASQCPICQAKVVILTTTARQIPIGLDTVVRRRDARYGLPHWRSCAASRGLKIYRAKVRR